MVKASKRTSTKPTPLPEATLIKACVTQEAFLLSFAEEAKDYFERLTKEPAIR